MPKKKFKIWRKLCQKKIQNLEEIVPKEILETFIVDYCTVAVSKRLMTSVGLKNEGSLWSSWTANSDKKYMELNRAALNVNKPCVTSLKTAFPKDK